MPATSCFCQQDMWIGMKYSQMWQKGAVVREGETGYNEAVSALASLLTH